MNMTMLRVTSSLKAAKKNQQDVTAKNYARNTRKDFRKYFYLNTMIYEWNKLSDETFNAHNKPKFSKIYDRKENLRNEV